MATYVNNSHAAALQNAILRGDPEAELERLTGYFALRFDEPASDAGVRQWIDYHGWGYVETDDGGFPLPEAEVGRLLRAEYRRLEADGY